MHIIHMKSMSRTACLQEYFKFLCKYICSYVSEWHRINVNIYMCVLFMFTDNLKPAGAIQVAHEVHPDSAFHQKTPQVFAKLPSSSAQPSGKSQILDPGPTWGRTNNSTPALESTMSIGNPQMNSPRMVRDFHYAFFPEKLQEILNSFCC